MQSDINVTPMIDVLLVLLIIFMVIVPITSRGESARVPQPAKSDTKTAAVVLEVLRDGASGPVFRINQQTVSREDLTTRLAGIYARRAERVLFVKGDDQLSFTQIAEVIDICHAAGVEHVGLITPKVAAGR
jgi:biopolymer transport protein ExbD